MNFRIHLKASLGEYNSSRLKRPTSGSPSRRELNIGISAIRVCCLQRLSILSQCFWTAVPLFLEWSYMIINFPPVQVLVLGAFLAMCRRANIAPNMGESSLEAREPTSTGSHITS